MARRDERQGTRDAAGVGPYVREGARLESIRQQTWEIVNGSADVRGWEVRTVAGREVGRVQDLLVDPELREVVLLDVDLAGTTDRGLVPLRAAQIDRGARVIRVDSGDVLGEEAFTTYGLGPRATRDDALRREERDEARNDLAVREAAHRVAHDVGSAPREPVVIEEIVVRRRVVNAADVAAEEARGARVVDSANEGIVVDRPEGRPL